MDAINTSTKDQTRQYDSNQSPENESTGNLNRRLEMYVVTSPEYLT